MTSRAERLEHRLRGAQRRQVKDVSFEIILPTAQPSTEPALPTSQFVQSETSPLPSVRRTPRNRNGTEATPTEEPGTVITGQPVVKGGNFDANISAKRKRLSTDDVAPSSSRSTRSSRTAPRTDIYALPHNESQDASTISPSNISRDEAFLVQEANPHSQPQQSAEPFVSPRRTRSTRTPSLPPSSAEQVTERPANVPGSGHRSGTGLADAVSKSSQLQIVQDSSLVETPTPTKRKRRAAKPRPLGTAMSPEGAGAVTSEASVKDMGDPSPDQLIERATRRKATIRRDSPTINEFDAGTAEQAEAEAIDDLEAAAISEKNRRRRVSRDIQPEQPVDPGEVQILETVGYKRRKLNRMPKSVNQSPPTLATKNVRQNPKKTVKNPKLRNGTPIPVIVHRLARQQRYDEDEPDAEKLESEIPYSRRPGVNAVDVLSQACQEIIGSGLENLEESASNADEASVRREYKTKWQALKLFGQEIQARLLDHTLALDDTYNLTKRIQQQQRRKQALRDAVLRLRAQRQQIALQMDEIRIQHESESIHAQDRDTLNTAAYELELAVERAKASESKVDADGGVEKWGVQVLLQRMAAHVSDQGYSVGILDRIKNLNNFLERAAAALESTKA